MGYVLILYKMLFAESIHFVGMHTFSFIDSESLEYKIFTLLWMESNTGFVEFSNYFLFGYVG